MKPSHDLTERIDACLPQSQCQQCGYAGCKPYAEAIVNAKAPINLCAPGGKNVLNTLASIMDVSLDAYLPFPEDPKPAIVWIDESSCIGCTKCIQACPVDAVIGSAKTMHSIITDECTGCGLCIPVCPMDCIYLKNIETSAYDKDKAKKRYETKKDRKPFIKTIEMTGQLSADPLPKNTLAPKTIQENIQASLERVRKKKGNE